MARPLRFQAPDADYHIMARGDGGKDVFVNDFDREAFLDVLKRACERFGWRVHAYVLMGNHYHLLLETPQPNLVAGMKWLMGVFSQGWNRRRKRRGHVFQGRYKSVVVDGAKDGPYFRILADYIHLNPVRSGWVGGTTKKPLKSWQWSSFPYYSKKKMPEWLIRERVLESFQLTEGKRGLAAYCRYLEERAKDRKAERSHASLDELRKGWYLGDKEFGKEITNSMSAGEAVARGNRSGQAARAYDVSRAEQIAKQGLKFFSLPSSPRKLKVRGKWVDEKSIIASLIRDQTSVSNQWIADRLGLSSAGNVTQALGRAKRSKNLLAKKAGLASTLVFRD